MNFIQETSNPILHKECPICLDSLINKEFISFSTCNHKYHIKCINEWKEKSCPELIHIYKCPTCDELRDINIENSILHIPINISSNNIENLPQTRTLMQRLRRCFVELIR